jgi:hypothetical protein
VCLCTHAHTQSTHHNNVTNLIHIHFHNYVIVSWSSTCFGHQASIFRRHYTSSFWCELRALYLLAGCRLWEDCLIGVGVLGKSLVAWHDTAWPAGRKPVGRLQRIVFSAILLGISCLWWWWDWMYSCSYGMRNLVLLICLIQLIHCVVHWAIFVSVI